LGGEDPSTVEHRLSGSLLSRTRTGNYAVTSGARTIRQGDYFFGWSHIAAHRLTLPRATTTIALIRDPIARVLSYYRYLTANYTPQGDMTWRVQPDERALAGNSFVDLLNRIPDELLCSQLYMFSAKFRIGEAAENILKCSAIMTTENYERDLRDLATTLGLPLGYMHERITTNEDTDRKEATGFTTGSPRG
jgi:hypothetical protein